jgi:VIT1/CCC1 family predicted Fe2+/Mn2+ transporter
MVRSNFLKLNWRDLLKGLLLAVLSAVITFVYTAIQGGIVIDGEFLKRAGMVAIATVLSYLLKNLFENSNGDLAKVE